MWTPTTTTDLFESLKPLERVTFTADPLAVALSHRRGTDRQMLQSDLAGDSVTNEDIEYAKEIYDYYKRKYFFESMTNSITPFQKEVLKFISNYGNPQVVKDKQYGIFIKLPYFYEEDIKLDEFKKSDTIKTKVDDYKESRFQFADWSKCDPVTLTHIGKTKRWAPSTKMFNYYWFTDEKNFLYNVKVPENTMFLKLFEEYIKEPFIFQNSRPITNTMDLYYFGISHAFKGE